MEQRMRSGMLNISGDGRQIWTNVNVDQYNRVVPGTAAERVIVYYNHDQDGSNVWIRVADSGQMNISISGKTLDASTTPTSTHRPSRSQSASGPSTSDTPTTETTTRVQSTTIAVSTTDTSNSEDIVTAFAVVCGILVLIIVVLVIYTHGGEAFRKKHDTSSNTGTSAEHEVKQMSTMEYSPNTSEAGDEHNYGHITSSEGPFYANSLMAVAPSAGSPDSEWNITKEALLCRTENVPEQMETPQHCSLQHYQSEGKELYSRGRTRSCS
ncbi:uncharacterized protein LOC124289070 [Haliotis rubra]|uniref:uncharacterized protein LOC124289070 n=1 Tax=Haliotis rubra TaxID=36100 RepID=UPI001EE5C185|nr:uncharacterized protein LOC124289070 [Haliotis rubra]